MRTILIAAAALALTSGAYAQSTSQPATGEAVENPAVPGSGFRIPESQATGQQPVQSGQGVENPAVPGSGYMIPQSEGRQVPATPKGAGEENPAIPGSGYSTK